MTRAAVTGWGTAVPEQRLTNAELEKRVDTTDAWIIERTGIRERRIADESETTASLAVEAGTAAIKQAGITPGDVDLLIVATATPEQPIPHTGAFVGEGLPNFDAAMFRCLHCPEYGTPAAVYPIKNLSGASTCKHARGRGHSRATRAGGR